MSDPLANDPKDSAVSPKSGYGGFLNYFGKDRWIHVWFAEKRTKLFSAVFPPFVRLGLVPDTISYIGISLLAGVILYFVRKPVAACFFLAGHVICDGLDGAYARHTGKASQSGAFTDLVCDQLGMIVVAMLAIFHHLVSPLLGAAYIALYLIVVVFGVIINVMGLETRITVTSKFLLYIVYFVWACCEVNLIPALMTIFSLMMTAEVVVGYFRLKRGIRKKYDASVRFTEGDPYSGRLNYGLNAAVPLIVLIAILVGANRVPIRAAFQSPTAALDWKEGQAILLGDDVAGIAGMGVADSGLLLLVKTVNSAPEIRRFSLDGGASQARFSLPGYFEPGFTTLPLDGSLLLAADRTTHLLMGIDLDESFRCGRALIALTLPMGHLRVTAMGVAARNGKTVWLAANYLYTRKTYVVDPTKCQTTGHLLGGEVASYINGGFPSGIAAWDGSVVELNSSPFGSLLHLARLDSMTGGKNILDASLVSFEPPRAHCIGPVVHGDRLFMVSSDGRLFSVALSSLVKSPRPQQTTKLF